jgi:hypothetical protein
LVLVAVGVDVLVFLVEMELPGGVEITAGDQRAQE